MDLQEQHNELAIPRTEKILGIRLAPLCVGHIRLLPALGLDGPETLSELVGVLLLLSLRPSQVIVRLQSWWWRLWAYSRAAWIGFCARVLSGKLTSGPIILTLAGREKLKQWISEAKRRPRIIPRLGGANSDSETPELAHVEHTLGTCGFSAQQIADMPLQEALFRFSVALEASGNYVLRGDDEIADEDYDALQKQADEVHARFCVIQGGAPC